METIKSKKKAPCHPILIIDDLKTTVAVLTGMLSKAGFNHVVGCTDSRTAMDCFYRHDVETVLLDLKMPHIDGESLLLKIKDQFPDIPVIVVTGKTKVEVAVNCMKSGAFDYISKPIDKGRLISAVKRALEIRELKRENDALKKHFMSETLDHPEAFSHIITKNRKMLSIFQYVESIAKTRHPVLITGETGVGKELIAKAIHALSGLTGEMVPVNLAGLDDIVFSDTIFGHAKGAYTGAQHDRGGLIEKAAGGTLFLDEIGEIGKEAQVKLLRLIQEGEYYALGSDTLKQSTARIITATNKDPWTLEEDGAFRKDLIFRLQTHHIHIPKLSRRKGDIPLLIRHFVDLEAENQGIDAPDLSNELFSLLKNYPFQGNVRELQCMVYDAMSCHTRGKLSFGKLSLDVFKNYMNRRQGQPEKIPTDIHQGKDNEAYDQDSVYAGVQELPTLKEASRQLIKEAVKRTGGNQSAAAKLLGITQPALNYRLKKDRIRPL